MDNTSFSYEGVLRVLGARLDELGASRVRVMETPDGFAVRYRPDGGAESRTLYVDREQLQRARAELEQRRNTAAKNGHILTTTGYSDVLRAMGHELDDVAAKDILLDEMEGLTLIRYLYMHNGDGSLFEERVAAVEDQEIQGLLSDAYGRRGDGAGAAKTAGEPAPPATSILRESNEPAGVERSIQPERRAS